MSQAELAKKLGMQPAAISKYETGRSSLSEAIVAELCTLFNVSSDYLLGYTDMPSTFSNPNISDSPNNINYLIKASNETFLLLEQQHNSLINIIHEQDEEKKQMITRLYNSGTTLKELLQATGYTAEQIKTIVNKSTRL